MKKNKFATTGVGLLVAVTGAFGLSACSNGGTTPAPESARNESEVEIDVREDLTNARQAVADALAEDDSWTQIMLASDVEAPTVKYGLLVVPFTASDAAERVTGTVNISDGKYTIEADSAATGETWQIDQDGTITQVTE